jgi:hypothetical protein
MAEDWRVTVRLGRQEQLSRALTALHEHQVEGEARGRLGGRIAATGQDDCVFLYADTDATAREAERVVSDVLTARDIQVATTKIEHWHHAEERWEDATKPTPSAPAQTHAEHERLEEEEKAESERDGIAEWEIRIEFASHHDARLFEQRLEHEGFRHLVRRWRFLIVGTDDKDDADAWAQRLRDDLPEGATLHVEPGSGLAWEFFRGHAFAVFGGLGV